MMSRFNLKLKIKGFLVKTLINIPSKFLPADFCLLLWIAYGRLIYIFFRRSEVLRYIEFIDLLQDGKLYRALFFDGSQFFFIDAERAPRYIFGVCKQACRLLNQYGISRHFEPKGVFLDIGANVGELSYYFAKQGWRVIAVEPDNTNAQALKRNLSSFKDKIRIYEKALGVDRRTTLLYSKPESGDSSIHKVEGARLRPVKVITLSEVLNDFIESNEVVLMKMDAEGHEPEVLLGAGKRLAIISYMFIDAGREREGETTYREVMTILKSSGEFEVKLKEPYVVQAIRIIDA